MEGFVTATSSDVSAPEPSSSFRPRHERRTEHAKLRSVMFRVEITLLIVMLFRLSGSATIRAYQPHTELNEGLFAALRQGNAAACKSLLDRGVDANARDGDDDTALMYACLYSGAKCVGLLLDKGAKPNARNRSGATALIWAVGDIATVRLLLSKGAEVDASSDTGNTALLVAVEREGASEVVKLLLERGANPNHANKHGETALVRAAAAGDVTVLRMLLSRHPDVNAKDDT